MSVNEGDLAARPPPVAGALAPGVAGMGVVRRVGRVAVTVGTVGAVLAAGVWAYSANVGAGRARMDMSMRVTSGDTPFPVSLVLVQSERMAGRVTYTGSVAPFNEEDIYPRVTGRIVEMPVYPGDAVRAGQVVARLDDIELSSRLQEAEAMLAAAQAGQAQVEADVVVARHGIAQVERELAAVEAELAYALAVAKRSERLVQVGAIAQQEYENDRSMATALEARREAARAKLEQARALEMSARRRLEASASMVAQAKAQLHTARVVRDYVDILAPSAGYVVKRLVAPGVLVQPGMAILKLTQIDRVRLQANVGEQDIASIRVGSPVTVTTSGAGRPAIRARVTSVFPFVDQGARTAVVEAVVGNPGRRLLPGQYVTMQFTTAERAGALTVPRGAVTRLGGTATVWTVRDGRAEPRMVETGLEDPERVEIVSGLAGGEQVIARGHEGLYAGARVAEASAPAPLGPGPGDPQGPGMSEQLGPGRPASGPAPRPAAPATPRGGAHDGH